MVWKDNLIVDDEITTFEGYLEDFLGYQKTWRSFELFHMPLIWAKDPRDVIKMGMYLDNPKRFPKNYFFANFKCLRCGLCCKNYECVPIDRELALLWLHEKLGDLLKYVNLYDFRVLPEIYPRKNIGCPMCRKETHKPYFGCQINKYKKGIPICKAYLCSKSIPVADLEYSTIDELIDLIGLDQYFSLIEQDWGEEFDYSKCWKKTH